MGMQGETPSISVDDKRGFSPQDPEIARRLKALAACDPGTQWQMAADRSGQVSGADPKSTSPLANVAKLANVPSQPGPHIEKIKALGDNEWLNLGSPAPDPKWGKAGGRSWGAKMPAAPNLRGAFLAGQGPHAYIKLDGPGAGFMDDDIWFYDINAHRWVCVYPGTNATTFTQQVKNGQIKVVNGQVVDETGQPIPLVVLLHAWGQVTYNPDESTFAFYSGWNGATFLTPPSVTEGLNLLIAQGNGSVPCSPWFYRALAGKFECYPVTFRVPNRDEGAANQLVYIPTKKQYLSIGRDGTFFFDPVARKWVDTGASGPTTIAIDNSATYDSKRDRVYFGMGGYIPEGTLPGDNFFIYDVKTNRRSKPYPQGNFPMGWSGTNSAPRWTPQTRP
jgi:hypothetical protein